MKPLMDFRIAVFVFLACLKEITCLKNVQLHINPSVVPRGQRSTLSCDYDLEDMPLYTVKWYRGNHEFYRFTPSEHPNIKIFKFPGINVDIEASDNHQVVLHDVGFNLGGKFTCEVTTDAPVFKTEANSRDMQVVVLPHRAPTLTTDKTYYDVGDVLKANCTSAPSRPAANLTFVLNNIVVCEKCEPRKHYANDLRWTDSTLELPLFPSHFHKGRLVLKCVAEISDLYQQDTEITIYTDRDPIPARVTQSGAGCVHQRQQGRRILMQSQLLLLLFVFVILSKTY